MKLPLKILLILFIAGMANGLMDTIAHHPDQLSWIPGTFGEWVRGDIKITGDWMIGGLYLFKDGWHFVKQIYIATFFMLILIQFDKRRWFWFMVMMIGYWMGFVFIYHGVFR